MKLHVRLSSLAVLALGLTFQAASSRADTFDWNNLTYAPSATYPAGSPVPDGNSTSGNNSLSTQMVLSTGAAFYTGVTSPAVASNSQNTNIYASGGNADNTQKDLQIAVNFANNTQFVTVTVFFAKPVVSASFSFFDVDSGLVNNGGYIDQVRSIQAGTSTNPGALAPTLTAGADNTINGNAVTAQAKNPIDTTYTNMQNAAGGNVGVSFSSNTPFSQISFIYGDTVPTGTTHSAVQIVALSNLTFTTVPEPGTLAMLSFGALGAGAIAFRRHRA